MHLVASIGGLFAAIVACMGIVQVGWGVHAVNRFAAAPQTTAIELPPVTVLKPLHGDEPLLAEALETFFAQDYPDLQLVFGVHAPTDPAIAVVRDLRARYPDRDATLVIDGARHGANHKISNVINMMGLARHDILVVADSDVHAAPDYLRRIVTSLDQPPRGSAPPVGLVTTLYAGMPAHRSLTGWLGSSYISHVFLPGALLARLLGRQDCLGATMALRRATLEAAGGFHAIADHLADDAVLGRRVRALGLRVALAATVPTTTVPEATLGALLQHELRWARTIRSLAPLGHALSLIQFPIAWAILAAALAADPPALLRALVLLAIAWAVRAVAAAAVDHRLGLPRGGWATAFAAPLRDLLCVGTIIASYRGRSVRWRGQVVKIDQPAYARGGKPHPRPKTREPALEEG